jgi:hypothetical protein
MIVEIWTEAEQFLFWEYCFEFSVLRHCSVIVARHSTSTGFNLSTSPTPWLPYF